MGEEQLRVRTLDDNLVHVVAIQANVGVNSIGEATTGRVGQLLCGRAYFPAGYSNLHTKGLPATVASWAEVSCLRCAGRQ